jgi:tetratricopeptide (TPR) repeat protein
MRVRSVIAILLLAGATVAGNLPAQTHPGWAPAKERAALHSGPEWQTIAPHLPDPQTASAASLEQAADVLMARRFPEDALDYYAYAMARGGNVGQLLNKMGVIHLELGQDEIAREMFLRNVHARKKDAIAWNNLGVSEYAGQHYGAAISDYKHATKLNRNSAVYHSNLALAYFQNKDVGNARQQFAIAIHLDPSIMQPNDTGGWVPHVVDSQNYPELCFEMAALYARSGDVQYMRLWLSKASERGFDVRDGMNNNVWLRPYLKDPEVQVMLSNAAVLRKRNVAAAPSLGDSGPGAPETSPLIHYN